MRFSCGRVAFFADFRRCKMRCCFGSVFRWFGAGFWTVLGFPSSPLEPPAKEYMDTLPYSLGFAWTSPLPALEASRNTSPEPLKPLPSPGSPKPPRPLSSCQSPHGNPSPSQEFCWHPRFVCFEAVSKWSHAISQPQKYQTPCRSLHGNPPLHLGNSVDIPDLFFLDQFLNDRKKFQTPKIPNAARNARKALSMTCSKCS